MFKLHLIRIYNPEPKNEKMLMQPSDLIKMRHRNLHKF